MILLGLLAYFLTGRASVTALIPAFFGLPILLMGLGSVLRPGLRKHLMHAAAVVALLAFFGTVGSLRFALYMISVGPTHVDNPNATIVQSLMALLSGAYLYLSIRSFIQARRNRAELNP
jgi:uncharacterized membrane protein YjjP (DUF1212 family)